MRFIDMSTSTWRLLAPLTLVLVIGLAVARPSVVPPDTAGAGPVDRDSRTESMQVGSYSLSLPIIMGWPESNQTPTPSPTPDVTETPGATRVPRSTPLATRPSVVTTPPSPRPTPANEGWHYPDHRMRLPFVISVTGHERQDHPAEVSINFSTLMTALGESGPFNPDSLRVVEVNLAGVAVDLDTPFQFDPVPTFDPTTNAAGTLVVLLTGQTNADDIRNYQVYFDTAGSFTPAAVAPRLTLTDNVQDEGLASIRVTSTRQTLYFHKTGGGFSSLIDTDGNDWIGWSAATGAAGDFRGIPNMVFPKDGGFFHPGRTTSTTTVLDQGPLRVTVRSTSNNGQWESLWHVYPDYARLTVTRAPSGYKYWLLYEGVPGGRLDAADQVVRSDGSRISALGSWNGDMTGEEWASILDPALSRSIFLIHEEDDSLPDTYRPLDDQMTVLGFGRDAANGRYLTETPKHFTFGLTDLTDHEAVAQMVRGVYSPLEIKTGSPEKR